MSKHYVYRCYDAADRLLYIGCTENLGARMAVHMSSGQNMASIVLMRRMDHMEYETCPDKQSAQAAEREAIYNEAPLANLHHQKVRETPADRERRLWAYIEETRPPADPELSRLLGDALAGFGKGVA